ncbi:MAG: aminomethyl-transferring glycine dehydrogenase [Bacteroidetes bacterium]|nr:aminomethyl-transferring glycine dehydrogenase [Bacteroidota bacterium]
MTQFTARKEHFQNRHIGPNANETAEMLKTLELNSLDELIEQTVPANIRKGQKLNLPEGMSEYKLLQELKAKASANQVFKSYLGQGYYDTIVPPVILRNILENPGWYTQYTPYQAEISQGRLESLLNFQTMVIDLTGMELANASLLDEATAAAESMHLMQAVNKKAGNKLFVSNKLFTQTKAVIETRAEPTGVEIVYGDYNAFEPSTEYFGAVVQFPDENGQAEDYSNFITNCHNSNVLVTVCADIMSLLLMKSPGEMGADVVVGSTQRMGVPMGFGGPHAAFMGTREDYKRQMPGRIIGVSIDAQGNTAYRMALQTREQHIKREKATSNICTAQALLANISAMYCVYHGPEGLKSIASRIHGMAQIIEAGLVKMGLTQLNTSYFDTLKFSASAGQIEAIRTETESRMINLRYFEDGHFGISVDETVDFDDVNDLLSALAAALGKNVISTNDLSTPTEFRINASVIRTSEYLTHSVFNSYHSETEMLRYLKRIENKDLSLTHSMIPLGSCTMKLNATTEMIPVTWPEIGGVHPFAPKEQVPFYYDMFEELEAQLSEITGFAAVSLQPNAGSQGEYAGLMVIREYLKANGQGHRNICLIPASAHGTNPASAVMAGMQVVVTKTDENGNIDMGDLKEKAAIHSQNLAALMVTYPSTHGVFEETIIAICDTIHQHGGQVYMDGANMNAQVGLTSPGIIGADVCHLNLHKTFCIPHGGGGPGMGPIGVAAHLAPYLPGHSVVRIGGENGMKAVSAAPYGSASILMISYVYNKLMGGEGLTNATKYAILGANYIAKRLKGHYDVLYKGQNDRVAHELIVDLRGFKQHGIEAEDVAKRLMDYGFHAPTLSFPVAGTLMIEPTESENKAELDRFCDALISIRKEIEEVATGQADAHDNVLKNAPHTMKVITADEWHHPYSRTKAAYPLSWVTSQKFWASVGRVDSTYGDRNLVCACIPIEEYANTEALIA